MMPNFYDGSRPTMVPTGSNLPVLLGNTVSSFSGSVPTATRSWS